MRFLSVAPGFVKEAFAYLVTRVDIPGGRIWPLKDICQKAPMTLELWNRA